MDVNTPTYGVTSTTETLFGRASLRIGRLRSCNLHDRYASPAPRNLESISKCAVKRNERPRIRHRLVIDRDAALLDQSERFALRFRKPGNQDQLGIRHAGGNLRGADRRRGDDALQ